MTLKPTSSSGKRYKPLSNWFRGLIFNSLVYVWLCDENNID